MKESITDELKGIIKSGENLLRELKGDFAVPGTVRNLTKEFLQFSELHPEIFFQIYSPNGNCIVVDLKDLYMRLPEDLQHVVIGEKIVPQSPPVCKLSNKQKKLIACIAMRPEGVPSSFIRPMMGATCDPKIAIKPAIDAGFIKVRKERGINFFLATPEGAVIGSTTTHYDFIRYNEWFVETHPKIKDEWNLLVKFLLEGNNLKFRCPPKATARAIYMTGLFMDMSDGNDQSITLSEFGAWFRVEYLNQLDELTKP